MRLELVRGVGPGALAEVCALADRLRSLDVDDLVDVQVVERPGPAALVLAAPGAPLRGTDLMLNWGHGTTRDGVVVALWESRVLPFARRLAGLTGSVPTPPVLHPHDQRWAVTAHRQLTRLADALVGAGLDPGQGPDAWGYEHIGSTSVPGLLAKPFVDLQLGVDEIPPTGGRFDQLLLGCGYLPAVGSRPDSPGVDRDLEMFPGACADEDYRKRLFFRPDPVAPVILHVRRRGTPWHDYPIRFRELLRTSEEHRGAYERVKTAAADVHAGDPDFDDYTRAKGQVIRDALVAASCEPGDLETLPPLTAARPETVTPRRTRLTARVLPVDEQGRVLLLHGVDPDDRDHPLWFSLGGEIDPGEDPVAAALRELGEEVGLIARPQDVRVLGEHAIEFSWGGVLFDQQQVLCAVRVTGGVLDLSGQDAVERATIDDARWWDPAELAASGDAVGEGLVDWVARAAGALR